MQLILASSSAYRRALLARLRLAFDVVRPEVDEAQLAGESAAAMALRLASMKAQAVAKQFPEAVVIGSDQTLDCEGVLLGKPGTAARALQQLTLLQGRSANFHTAYAVLAPGRAEIAGEVLTRIRFRSLTNEEIQNYVRLEPAFDCAGAAKAEALGICLTEAIESVDPTAIIGLPLIAIAQALRQVGMNPLAAR